MNRKCFLPFLLASGSRKQRLVYASASLLLLSTSFSFARASERVLNGGFEQGLKSWQTTGSVHLETNRPLDGKISAVIGPESGSLSQRIETGSGNDFTVCARIQVATSNGWAFTLRFLDQNAKELMTVSSLADLKRSKKDPRKFEHFMKAHPLTRWVELCISRQIPGEPLLVDQVGLDMEDENAASARVACDIDEAMKPFWRGKKVYHEAVLLLSSDGKPASGRLLFAPSKIIAVQDYGLTTNYSEDADYTVTGRTLICSANSRMPRLREDEFAKGEFKWNVVGGKQVMVTYEHQDSWHQPFPSYLGEGLPNTLKKLKAHEPLVLVAYGDSITHGVGASRLSHICPFLPPWPDLFARRLKTIYGDEHIQLYNSAQSGATSDWGKAYAQPMVAALNPDLVLIAFGQNDFWGVSAASFASNIAAIIKTVRQRKPDAEFLLVSTLRFDPAYTSRAEYWGAVGEYEARLKGMIAPGVQFVDMTAISEAVYAAKKPLDCLNDPLHPNDYFARWYAQAVAAALDPAAISPSAFASSSGKKRVERADSAIP
jgi:lysophospholipase L1-like esterase